MKSTHQLNWYIVESSFQLGGVLLNIPLNILGINNVHKLKSLATTLVNSENMSWIKGHFWNILNI
jgi:uncharacterized membrane-anchored protein YitT (DUF2179 family)